MSLAARWVRRIVTVPVLTVLVSCDPGVSAADAMQRSQAVSELTCSPDAVHRLPVGHLSNNAWNRAEAGSEPWRQCLRSRVRDGRLEYGWSWQWPRRDRLYAYPAVLLGRSPWTDAPTSDPRFPRRIADIRALWVDYDIESSYRGKRNLAMEMWLTDKSVPEQGADARAISTELMIVTDATRGMDSDREAPDAIVSINGARWALYVKKNWGDASGGSSHRWTFLVYSALEPRLAIRYDARQFLQDAIDRDLVDPGHFVADLELGNEIVSGSGSTWLRRFEVTFEPP